MLSSWSHVKNVHPRPPPLSKTKKYGSYYVFQAEVFAIQVDFHSQVPTSHQPTGGIFLVIGVDRQKYTDQQLSRPDGGVTQSLRWGLSLHIPDTGLRAWQAWSLEPTPREALFSQWLAKTTGQGSQCPLS